MKYNSIYKKIVTIMAPVILLSISPVNTLIISAASATNDTIKKSESELGEAEEQKSALQSGMKSVEKILKELEGVKSNLANYVTQLDVSLNELSDKLQGLEMMIEEKESDIKVTQEALHEAKETEEQQYDMMKKRIRFMYEKGNSTYVEIMLESGSFSEFLNKAEYIQRVSEYDRKMLLAFIETKEEIAAAEAQLLEEQEELEKAMEQLNTEQDTVAGLIDAKEKEINNYESDINNKEQLIKDYKEEIAAQDKAIKALESAIAAEKRRLATVSSNSIQRYDGGQFAWPAPNYTRISDDYGNRIHPTLKVPQFHNGVDMAAPSGTPILAAYSGTVVAATYSGTMGNYIMLDHGDGLFTIYMHSSKLLVSQGAAVARGDKIALVGSTGRSTGPHLHFTVRLNGNYVSPWNYLK